MKALYFVVLLCLSSAYGFVTLSDVNGKYNLVEGTFDYCGTVLEVTSSGSTIAAEDWLIDGGAYCTGVFQTAIKQAEEFDEQRSFDKSVYYRNRYGSAEFECGGKSLYHFQLFRTEGGSFVGGSHLFRFSYQKGRTYLVVAYLHGGHCVYTKNENGAGTAPAPSPPASPIPIESSPSTDASPSPTQTEKEPTIAGSSSQSIWVWLGPVLGFTGAILAALIRVYCVRNSP